MARLPLASLCLLALAACARDTPDAPAAPGSTPGIPHPRAGHDVLGADLSAVIRGRRIGEAPAPGAPGAKATLVRWWTDTCPFCEASLPAIEALRRRYAGAGLATLGVYHPKPPRPVSDADVLAAAERLGYGGPLLVDHDWATLRSIWLDTGPRPATSASFLLDADGIVRFVHPGPEFFPSDDPAEALADRDHADMVAAIEALLAE